MKFLRFMLFSSIIIISNSCRVLPRTDPHVPATLPATAIPASTETASPTTAPLPTATAPETARPAVTRVVIISIDGLRPDAIDMAPMPTLQGLMTGGAYSLSSQTITPSTTLPANASMVTGLCPSAHGVTWDQYLPGQGIALGTDLFDLAHAMGMRTMLVTGKEKLRQVTDATSLDVFQWVNDPDVIVGKRASALIPQGFSVLFVQFPDGDLEGHTYGWMSLQQLLGLRGTDDAVKELLDALGAADMRQNTLIIVTADHGGHGTTHGFDIPADMTIPWIINGPGVVHKQLTYPINVTDTAATAAWALGLPLPSEWSGIPVYEAFGLPDPGPRPAPRCQ